MTPRVVVVVVMVVGASVLGLSFISFLGVLVGILDAKVGVVVLVVELSGMLFLFVKSRLGEERQGRRGASRDSSAGGILWGFDE